MLPPRQARCARARVRWSAPTFKLSQGGEAVLGGAGGEACATVLDLQQLAVTKSSGSLCFEGALFFGYLVPGAKHKWGSSRLGTKSQSRDIVH